jgi:hypothetical protein
MRQFQLEMTRYNRSDMDIYGNIGTSNQLITQATLDSLNNNLVAGSVRSNMLLTDNLTILQSLDNYTSYAITAALRDICKLFYIFCFYCW